MDLIAIEGAHQTESDNGVLSVSRDGIDRSSAHGFPRHEFALAIFGDHHERHFMHLEHAELMVVLGSPAQVERQN